MIPLRIKAKAGQYLYLVLKDGKPHQIARYSRKGKLKEVRDIQTDMPQAGQDAVRVAVAGVRSPEPAEQAGP